jgi:hypothetical protein
MRSNFVLIATLPILIIAAVAAPPPRNVAARRPARRSRSRHARRGSVRRTPVSARSTERP